MIIASCPLRISLFGGSTDNPYFVKKYGYGSVISFTSDLKTYVTIVKISLVSIKISTSTLLITLVEKKLVMYLKSRMILFGLFLSTSICHQFKLL